MASLETLFEAAKAIQAKAYAPYSRFKVGAAIATPDGQVFTGCNVENAAYPVGACAEAGAISAMVAGGGSRIAADRRHRRGRAPRHALRRLPPAHPRVRRARHADPCRGPEGIRRSFTLDELLPFSFGPDNLKGR